MLVKEKRVKLVGTHEGCEQAEKEIKSVLVGWFSPLSIVNIIHVPQYWGYFKHHFHLTNNPAHGECCCCFVQLSEALRDGIPSRICHLPPGVWQRTRGCWMRYGVSGAGHSTSIQLLMEVEILHITLKPHTRSCGHILYSLVLDSRASYVGQPSIYGSWSRRNTGNLHNQFPKHHKHYTLAMFSCNICCLFPKCYCEEIYLKMKTLAFAVCTV